MAKSLRKAIMRRPQLQTKYFKNESQSNYLLFKKQKKLTTFVVNFIKKKKRNIIML